MFERFRHRSRALERLDTGDFTRKEYERWQREMRWIHAFWGEAAVLDRTLVNDVRKKRLPYLTVLDVGAGTGNILRIIKSKLSDRDVSAMAAETSDDALSILSRERKRTGVEAIKCSGLRLPFEDHSIDYVVSTLVLHHLDDNAAVKLISEMCRVARRRFYAIDLNRHPVGYYGWRFISPFLFQKFTREDGALSILRSFTAEELLALAKEAGVSEVKVENARANRLVLSGR